VSTVVHLSRYPVKSAGGEQVSHLRVTPRGAIGDRCWAVAEPDGTIVSAKHPRRAGLLPQLRCHFDDRRQRTALTFPDGRQLTAGGRGADQELSNWLGRPLRLVHDPTSHHQMHRLWPMDPGLVPEWQRQARPGTAALTRLAGPSLRQSFVDYGALHIITTGDLERLSQLTGGKIPVARFRPNIVVDGTDRLNPGSQLQVGPVILMVDLPTPRCVVPGLRAAEQTIDADLLHALAGFDRRRLPGLGHAACFGAYATPTSAGTIRSGDPVVPL